MLLELEEASVHYGGIVALERASIGLDAREIVAVMGPRVYWDQQLLPPVTHTIVHVGIAFVAQGRRVFPGLTVEENLEMACVYLKDRAEREGRLGQVMTLFPILQEKRWHHANQLSGGQQQMLVLGRALMSKPRALLLDEPTLGLAPNIVRDVFGMIERINHELGTAILVVEHNVRSMLSIARRAYVLDKGRVVHSGSPESVQESDILTRVFLGQV
jgi:branched-chain amino acid transport system ATP-binding protein